MTFPPLRFATFLAPNVLPVYRFLVDRIGARLGVPATLRVGSEYQELGNGIDAAFVCGLAYLELNRRGVSDVEPLAAPLLHGERFNGRPVYYSDVIVRRESPFQRFADLRGRSWSFNEEYSQSGYGITRYRLVQLGETAGFFGRVVAAGWHERSIRLVCSGEVDASAIDCQVLAVALREDPELAGRLRVIDSFGPSTIQPLVVARRLPRFLKDELLGAVLALNEEAEARQLYARAFIERFVPVTEEDYDDLRAMRAACERAGCLTFH
jgi:phosphonate transport system substrate-binding protein